NELHQAYFSSDGSKIYLLDGRSGVYVYDSKSGKKVGEFSKDYGAYNCRNLINKESTKILSTGNYSKFYVLDLINGDTLVTIPFDKAYSLSFSPDGKYIAASSTKLFAKIYDASTGKEIYDLRFGTEE